MKRARKKSSARATQSRRQTPAIKKRARSRTKIGRAARARADKNMAPLDDLIAAAAQALDLKLDPAWKPAIRGHLRVALDHAALVNEFALPDDLEPAPVFEA